MKFKYGTASAVVDRETATSSSFRVVHFDEDKNGIRYSSVTWVLETEGLETKPECAAVSPLVEWNFSGCTHIRANFMFCASAEECCLQLMVRGANEAQIMCLSSFVDSSKEKRRKESVFVDEVDDSHRSIECLTVKKSELFNRESDLISNGVMTIFCSVALSMETRQTNCGILHQLYLCFESRDKKLMTVLWNNISAKTYQEELLSSLPSVSKQTTCHRNSVEDIFLSEKERYHFLELQCFVYYREIPILTIDSAKKIYKLAESYSVPELKKICLEYLSDVLAIEKISDLLLIIDEKL